MGDDTTFFTTILHPSVLLEELAHRVEGTADFKGTDALQILALEP